MDAVPDKPVPRPTPETAPYWEGARRSELLVQRCRSCAQHYFYPRTGCPHCGSTEAAAQVPGVEVSVAQGVGGMFMSAGTLVLGTAAAAGA